MTTLPKIAGKGDVESVRRLAAIGYPAIASALPDIVGCLQDGNWPVANEAFKLLVSIGVPVIPEIRRVFTTDDEMWKYWCIALLKRMDREVFEALRPEITRIAIAPTEAELREEVAGVARELLTKMKTQPNQVPLPTPASSTPAADAPVAPPSGAAGH